MQFYVHEKTRNLIFLLGQNMHRLTVLFIFFFLTTTFHGTTFCLYISILSCINVCFSSYENETADSWLLYVNRCCESFPLNSSVNAMSILEATPLLFQDMILQTLIHTGSPDDFHRTFTFIRLWKVRSLVAELCLTVTDKYTTKFSAVLSSALQGNDICSIHLGSTFIFF